MWNCAGLVMGLASFIQPGGVVCVSNSLPGTLLCSQHHRKIQVGQAAYAMQKQAQTVPEPGSSTGPVLHHGED